MRAGSAVAADRPAEVFARGADWFVASSLAFQGRMNGFLSAIEDDMLAGYAAGAPAAVGLTGATSLTAALDEMTYLPDSVRDPFESQWSDPAVVDPVLLVRRALETPVSWRLVWQQRSGAAALIPPGTPSICTASDSPESRARERLLMLAVDARARGAAMRRARFRAPEARADWANSVLGTVPWSSDQGERLVADIKSTLLAQIATATPNQGVLPTVAAIFASSAESCSSIRR
jgi:hypothetical protein